MFPPTTTKKGNKYYFFTILNLSDRKGQHQENGTPCIKIFAIYSMQYVLFNLLMGYVFYAIYCNQYWQKEKEHVLFKTHCRHLTKRDNNKKNIITTYNCIELLSQLKIEDTLFPLQRPRAAHALCLGQNVPDNVPTTIFTKCTQPYDQINILRFNSPNNFISILTT